MISNYIDELVSEQYPEYPVQDNLVISGNRLVLSKPRLRSAPRVLDPSLPVDHPEQTVLDCSSVEGWMQTIDTLLHQAWGSAIPFNFTHDYALIKNDPKNLPPVTIVWEAVSEAPGIMTKAGNRMIKPTIREVIGQEVSVQGSKIVPSGASAGATVVWGQVIDVIMMFSVYADSWARMYQYHKKFKDFMTSYAGVFIGTGLQQLWWQQSTRDALYDPPKNEAYPNRSMFYHARVDELTKANVGTIENVLIQANVLGPLAGQTSTTIVSAISGNPDSPILPAG